MSNFLARLRAIDDHRPDTYTVRNLLVLGTLAENVGPPMGVRELAEHLGWAKPPITRCCDRLVIDGLITREQDTKDRRLVVLAVTPRGHAMYQGEPAKKARRAA